MTRTDWMTQLWAAWDDADVVSQDMLRPPRERELGPAHHRKLYGDAADAIEHLLDHAPDEP